MKWLRCSLTDMETEQELTIDVLVNADSIVCPFYSYYGFWRSTDGSETYPVIFLNDQSAMDYGTEFGTDKVRYGKFPLHGRPMFEGARFSSTDSVGEIELIVKRCRDLVAENALK